MLFMVGAKATVVGATVFDRGIEPQGHVSRLDEGLGLAIVVNVVGDEDFFSAMAGAMFDQVNASRLKDDFGFYFGETLGAEAVGEGVEEVGAGGHG